MSSASATADAPQKGNKKLIIIIASAVLLLGIGGGAIAYVLKHKAAAAAAAADEEEGGEAPDAAEEAPPAKAEARKSKQVPTFVPLEPFVVNLADRETERFAQVGVTLEVDDAKFADELKAYMPAIRNGILMVLAHKTSAELLSQEGKLALQKEILRESVLPLGIEVEDEGDASPQGKRKKKRKSSVHNPVTKVHFSNFIVQ